MRHLLPKQIFASVLTALVLPGQHHSDGKLEAVK